MPQDEVVLGNRQIYILPTRHGLVFALALLVLLLASVNYASALAYLLTFLLASMAIVSLLHSQRNLLRLGIAASAGEPVFAGEAAVFRVCLRNPGLARFALHIEAGGNRLPVFDVPAHDTQCVVLPIHTTRRGHLDMPYFVVASVYPLGIARAWSRRLKMPVRALVYPKPADLAGFASLPGSDGENPGLATTEGDDFFGLRPYQPGDVPARISWKTLARGQGLHTKEFAVSLSDNVWLDWDACAPHDAEVRLSLLTRALLDADAAGLVYGMRLPGMIIGPAGGEAHRRRCLEALALYEEPASR
jgi:uncharacterized protein (DUF58 family)